jgi:hypothetical protein
MTDTGTLLQLIRQVRAQRHATDALEGERLRLEGSLIEFVEEAWPFIDAAPYQPNWAIDALCEHLQAVTEGRISRLLINFPPRCGKTIITSVCWIAWTWARRERTFRSGPQVRFLTGSYSHTLALGNANLTRRLILSPFYQRLWGSRFTFRDDQNTKVQVDNSAGGSRLATSVGGTLLGIGGDVLVVDDPHNVAQAESEAEREFNPTFDSKVIERALVEDRALFGAEYLSEWRDDLATFISRQLLEAAVDTDVIVRPPQEGVIYFAFDDPSGGARDSYTLGIAHQDTRGDNVILDLLYERFAPMNPYEVTNEIAALLRSYRCTQVVGDDYGKRWVTDAYGQIGIIRRKSELDRSGIYLNVLPLFTSGRARLLDNQRLINQFANLERRTFPGGKDKIDHERGRHDDLCNAAAGALTLASRRLPPEPPIVAPGWYGKHGGVYSEPSVYHPEPTPPQSPPAEQTPPGWPPPPNSPPQPTPKHLLKTQEANEEPIPSHYLKQPDEPWRAWTHLFV